VDAEDRQVLTAAGIIAATSTVVVLGGAEVLGLAIRLFEVAR
jgi:hypothetical protein